jgi:hypothetical protein
MCVAAIYYVLYHYVYFYAGFVGLDSSRLAMLIWLFKPKFKS